MSKISILLSNKAAELKQALAQFDKTATVEAEYGDTVVEGSVATLAHHGSRAHLPAPCSLNNFCEGNNQDIDPNEVKQLQAIGLSHIDLDSIGGVAALLGKKPEDKEFWDAAEFLDVNGWHNLYRAESEISETNRRKLCAMSAYQEENRIHPNKDGTVTDVSTEVLKFIDTIIRVLENEEEALLAAGDSYYKEQQELSISTLKKITADGVAIREIPANKFIDDPFTYNADGDKAKASVNLLPDINSLVLKLPGNPNSETNAITIVQEIYGTAAGGHAYAAGTPRDYTQKLTLRDAETLANLVDEKIANSQLLIND